MLVAKMSKNKFFAVPTNVHNINYVYIMLVAQMPKNKLLVILTTAHNIKIKCGKGFTKFKHNR